MRDLEATEKEHHLAFMKWAKLNQICKHHLIHIPNEGKRPVHYGRMLKEMGLKKGVSDFFLAYPVYKAKFQKWYHGLWIELKREKFYRVSKEQKDWISKMILLGYDAQIAYGAEDAIQIVTNYLRR